MSAYARESDLHNNQARSSPTLARAAGIGYRLRAPE